MPKHPHTPGNLDVFVGNADGRGLIRLEIRGTGQHIASMPRGAQSEADAARLSLCWDMHDEMKEALRKINDIIFAVGAPLGTENYFEIRTLCCDINKKLEGVK